MVQFATPPLGIVSFLLTPQEQQRKIPATFSVRFFGPGARAEKIARHSRGGETCNICRDGLCSVLTRSARHAATGCVQPTPDQRSAAIAAPRCAMFRHRSARACACVHVRSVVIVRRAARQDGSGSRRERLSGPLVPVTPGRAVPAITFLKNFVSAVPARSVERHSKWEEFSSTGTPACAVFAIVHFVDTLGV